MSFVVHSFMRILYFSRNYTPHDYRFLSSLSRTEHEVYYMKLETNKRQTEDRPVPENVQQILWAGGQPEFRWRNVPRLTFDFRRNQARYYSCGPHSNLRVHRGVKWVSSDSDDVLGI